MRKPSHITSYFPVAPDNSVRIVLTERFVGSSSKFYVGVEDYEPTSQEYIHRDGSAFTTWERSVAEQYVETVYAVEEEAGSRFNTPDEMGHA